VDSAPRNNESVPPPPKAPDPYLNTTIDGRYRVESVLGEGGMGVVYAGRHKVINKKVAIKVLRGEMSRDREMTERFLQEARAASSIGHPNIIDISDFGTMPDGSAYFVMEFLEGRSLASILQEIKPLPLKRLVHVAKQAAEGLQAAHSQQIVHRDLKPDNVFLIDRGSEKDFVKILDFGIAKVASSNTNKLTRAGTVFGTPHYMSPEQAAGAPVDHRTDIYALGVIMYELASGRVPFDADNYMGILTQHMYKAPVPIRVLVPPPSSDIPPGLEAIILKALSKKPEQRYQQMSELAEDLARLDRGEMPLAVSEMMSRSGAFSVPADYFNQSAVSGVLSATPPTQQRRWGVIAGVTGVLAAVGIVVAILGRDTETAAHPAPFASAAPVETVAQTPTPSATVAPPAVEPVKMKEVLLAALPPDSEFFLDDKSLGKPPVKVQVPEGKTVRIEVRHTGYAPRQVDLDGSSDKLTVKLERAKVGVGAPVKPPVTVNDKPPPRPKGGGDIVDPWAKLVSHPEPALRNEQLRLSLEEALSRGAPQRFFSLLGRHGGLPGPRPNLDLAAAVGDELASHRAHAQRLLDTMARLDEREAPGQSAQAFLLVVAAQTLGSRVMVGHEVERSWDGLQELAGDPRKVARDGVVAALERLGVRLGGAALLERLAPWTDGFLQGAVALEALARRLVLDRTPHEAVPLLEARLDELIALAGEARRADERTQGRRRLLETIAEFMPPLVARHQSLLPWLQRCLTTQQPELRDALESCIPALKRLSLTDELLDPLRQSLDGSRPALRDPTHYKGPTRGRGRKAQRREQRR
jgi:serine/threonine-protein kinase